MTDRAPHIHLPLPQTLGIEEASDLGRKLVDFATKVGELDQGQEGSLPRSAAS